MKRSLSIKILVLTLTLLVGSLAVAATEHAFSAHGRGVAAFVTDGAGKGMSALRRTQTVPARAQDPTTTGLTLLL